MTSSSAEPLPRAVLDALARYDTPTICNALELVVPSRRATGFTVRPLVCPFPDLPPVVGYARTATIRATAPSGRTKKAERAMRLAYYEYVGSGPAPRISVIQDLDGDQAGFGAFWGEVNTTVHKGLGVQGCITNGSIRDLDMIATDFQLLAGRVGPSHAWVHVEAIDLEVTVHGLRVRPGDLIHADRHGAVTVPVDLVGEVLLAIDLCTRREAPIIAAARQPDFTVERLKAAMAEADDIH